MLAGQSDSFIALAEATLSVFLAFSPLPQVHQSCACVKIGDMCVVSHVCGVHGNTILCCHSQVRSRLSLAITSRQLINSVLSAQGPMSQLLARRERSEVGPRPERAAPMPPAGTGRHTYDTYPENTRQDKTGQEGKRQVWPSCHHSK